MSAAPAARVREVIGRVLGERAYEPTWRSMREFTDGRADGVPDELWLVTHPPVFTLGQAGRREHVHEPGPIPVVQSDRGGQVTFHGPGQAVVYVLVDLRRAGVGVRDFVTLLEQSVIDVLAGAGLGAARREGAPGVYVAGAKVAALGLRVRNGCTYHGLALNVSMDLDAFGRIDPCGHAGLRVTDLRSLGVDWTVHDAGRRVGERLAHALGARVDWRSSER